jgi:hypothetical protein
MNFNLFRSQIRGIIGNYPILFYSLYGLKSLNRRLSVQQDTQLVIEGFPRSGNTFAVLAFEHLQSSSIKLAHHLHVIAQVKRAVQYSIPTLILIRDPKDVTISLIMRNPEATLLSILNGYIDYYTTISLYKDHFVTADFKELINDYACVIRAINIKFNTKFQEISPTPDDQDIIFAKISELSKIYVNGDKSKAAYPSAEKKALKEYWATKIDAPCLAPILSKAYSVYQEFFVK